LTCGYRYLWPRVGRDAAAKARKQGEELSSITLPLSSKDGGGDSSDIEDAEWEDQPTTLVPDAVDELVSDLDSDSDSLDHGMYEDD
jgi:hypothetical protein